jgi:hypothetical protein
MTPQKNSDYEQMVLNELQVLKGKVDVLTQDRVTRVDMEKLRAEMMGVFVDRPWYEARHTALIERNAQLESMIRDLRHDIEEDQKKIHERLESGKEQIEERFKQQQEKPWTRITQISGLVAMALVVLDWLSQHLRFP